MKSQIPIGGLLFVLSLGAAGCVRRQVSERAWYERPLPMTRHEQVLKVDGRSVRMEYGRVAPEHCPGVSPVVILLPAGAQNRNLMEETVRPWAKGFQDLGWTILSPVALDSKRVFYEDNASGLGPWLDAMHAQYSPHHPFALVGVSNGGISAFRAAVLRPHLFDAVVVLPGYAMQKAVSRIPPSLIVVGANDAWLEPAKKTRSLFEAYGGRVDLRVIPKAGHVLFEHVTARQLESWFTMLRGMARPACGVSSRS